MRAVLIGPPDEEIVALEAALRRAPLGVDVAGTLVRGTYRYTRVWAREHDDRWQVVGGHVSEVAPAGMET